jgi:hypothetical protein
MASDVNIVLVTFSGFAGPAVAVPLTAEVTAPMVSLGGTTSRTIAACVSPAASAETVEWPVTVGWPLELAALTVTLTPVRGVLSLVTTTKTTVPDGVAAAAVATTFGPDGVGVTVDDGVTGVWVRAAVGWEVLVAGAPASHPTSRASGRAKPTHAPCG